MKRRLRIQELRRGDAWTEIDDEVFEWDYRFWHDCAAHGCGDWYDLDDDYDTPHEWLESWGDDGKKAI